MGVRRKTINPATLFLFFGKAHLSASPWQTMLGITTIMGRPLTTALF
jgi:hypothetical protein